MDPNKCSFKKVLKTWVLENISKEGDYIFKGKVENREGKDWLQMELSKEMEKARKEIEDEEKQRTFEEELEEDAPHDWSKDGPSRAPGNLI